MMKTGIFYGWNIRRLFYLVAGLGLIVLSIQDQQWFGVAFGMYFAAMGLFSFGCAGGKCCSGACETEDAREKFNTHP